MKDFLKVSEAPETKLRLKKYILNGYIIVYEKDNNWDKEYKQLNDINSILTLWAGFNYAPKCESETSDATACLGTSFYYKFKKA
jgi:hypothetical protein